MMGVHSGLLHLSERALLQSHRDVTEALLRMLRPESVWLRKMNRSGMKSRFRSLFSRKKGEEETFSRET